jgi:ferredoxin
MPTVEFLDAGKKIDCGQYANLRKVALLHDVEVYKGIDQVVNCRGNGLCGTCVMEIVEGLDNLSPKNIRERNCFKLHGKPENYRLSCQTQVMGDVVCVTALDPRPAPAAKS